MRVKSRWHNKKRVKSVEEIAGALAFNTWRIASTNVNKMYAEGFNFKSNEQILDTIAEFLAFLVQAADRLVYERLDDDARQRFVTTLALKLADTMEDNRIEEQGPGEYRGAFIELLNQRLEAYAEFRFVDGEPGYKALRQFGSCVEQVMGGQDNKWVIEQIVDIEAPDVTAKLKQALENLFAGNPTEADAPADG